MFDSYRKLGNLQATGDYLADFVGSLEESRQALRDFKASGAEFVDREQVCHQIPIGNKRFDEVIAHQAAIKEVIDCRIADIRQQCGRIVNFLTRPSPRRRLVIEISLTNDGNHKINYITDPKRDIVIIQAEAVFLDQLIQRGDVEALRQFYRCSFMANVLTYEDFLEKILKPLQIKEATKPVFPIIYGGGFDYFDRPDLCLIDPKLEIK